MFSVIGLIVGIVGSFFTFMNTHLTHVEGRTASGGLNTNDQIGTLMGVLGVMFLVLSAILRIQLFRTEKN